MDDEQIEHTLYINREVKVYRIPPRPAAGGHRADSWRVDDCIFTGRLRVMVRGEAAEIRLENNSTGELFALCPFTPATQAVAVEPAVDSSRYYVLRVEDPGTRRHAFLGVGFTDRGAAFDFNAALADHVKQCQRESIVASHAAAAAMHSSSSDSTGVSPLAAGAAGGGSSWNDPAFAALYKDPGDLSLKEGQTIRIDVKRPGSRSGGGGFLARAADGPGVCLRTSTEGGSSSSGGGAAAAVLPPPPVLLPPPGQPAHSYTSPVPSPGAAAAAAAVTVASSEENWATFE